MDTTTRGYRKLADGELDKAQAVNDALGDVNDDVASIAQSVEQNTTQTQTLPAPGLRLSGEFQTATHTLTFTDGVLTSAVPL